jgi:predicted O-methyltransferase YrrM
MKEAIRAGVARLHRRVRPIPSARRFDYDRRLLVNPYLAEREDGCRELSQALARTGQSMGYPAWNLLYYTLLCGLPAADPVVVETGTNWGFSTIVLAQALVDGGRGGVVRTVDIDPEAVAVARGHAERAGVAARIRFHVGDSFEFLDRLPSEVGQVDFAFLDGGHTAEHVIGEFERLYPLVAAGGGKVYFDNTSRGGVAKALRHIHKAHGGNLIEFPSCSWAPPGNAIWQPDRRGRGARRRR